MESRETRPGRPWIITLVVLALATYGYFQPPPMWNENSRFDLTRAIVERQTFRIDAYYWNTGDKALNAGHVYSDKAPGAALFAVPWYALYNAVRTAPTVLRHGVDREPHGLALASFLSVALASALGLAAFFRIASRLGADREVALLSTLAWGFGSIAFPYSTVFFGHQLCGALLIVSFALVLDDRLDGIWRPRRIWLAGLAAGLAVLTEYPAVVGAALIFAYACALSRSPRVALWFCLGGLLPIVALAGYLTVCFGAPWRTGYAFVTKPEFEGMKAGFMGLTYPRPDVIVSLLVGSWRGLLLMCPILALGGVGLWRLARDGRRAEAWLCAAMVGFFLLLNASYYMWSGGSSLGPRHMVPGLGFLALGIVGLRDGRIRTVAWVLLGYSVITMLVCTAVGPAPPTDADPQLVYYWTRFLANEVAGGGSNLGTLVGLPGIWSLVPLLVIWAGAGWMLVRRGRRT